MIKEEILFVLSFSDGTRPQIKSARCCDIIILSLIKVTGTHAVDR